MRAPTKALIVEDDAEIAGLVADYLEANGFRVTIARDGPGLDRALGASLPDIVLLDLMLPGESGLSIARRLRQDTMLPLIMLTAAGEEADRVVGLEIGADDYVAKPFSLRELLARIRAVLRRFDANAGTAHDTTTLTFDGWTLTPHRRELTDPAGVNVTLTGAEFSLLQALCTHPRRVLTRDQLLDLTQGTGAAAAFDRSIDTLISRIRRKIEHDPRAPLYVKTVRLGGYMFTPEVERR
ncbi:MAG: response regulator [Pseudomonadota bacterium]